MSKNDTTHVDKQGNVRDRACIMEDGVKNLIGRTMYTATGFQTIKRITTHRYRACTVYFEDGTSELRDFDENFYLVPVEGQG